MEVEEKTPCLSECLKAFGLQHYYARFTSAGVHSAAHLSGLTMEDYHILGICSMDDRTRLFHLIQMVKTLELEYEDHDDDDASDEGFLVVDSRITCDGCGDPEKDAHNNDNWTGAAVSKLSGASVSKSPRVRRRLDFSSDPTINHHQKRFSRLESYAYANTSHNRNFEPCLRNVPTMPMNAELDSGGSVLCSCKGNSNHEMDVCSQKCGHHTGANTKTDVERNSMYSSHTRVSPMCASSHKPKPRPETVTSVRLSSKEVRHKNKKGISKKKKIITEISSIVAVSEPVYESKRTPGYNYGLPMSSPPAPNKKQPVGERICVCVRKRPLTCTEGGRGEADVVTALTGRSVTVHERKEAVDLTHYILQHRFYFDHVFGEESSNEEVYQGTAHPLVQHMLNGGNATCFAYGQTGAGKTHTMLGSSPRRPGLYTLAFRDIFAHLSATQTHSPLLVYVSFFEIYCGQLYDLLDHRKRLFAREDSQKVVHIAGLRDVRVDSISSVLEVISQGMTVRTQGMSGLNPLSSRSHAMLQIQLREPNQQMAGRIWFVDLAGSERASDTKELDRQSRMEGAEINQSLLALKECIRSLDQEQSHTPFRQSKLTQVLKDSFVGDSMTCMIANISPGHSATEQTLNTLRYADRVKELRGQAQGKRRSNNIFSPKQSVSSNNSNSEGPSVGIRGKSPPKRPKFGGKRQAFDSTASTTRLATGDAVPCSTPKNSQLREETSAGARKGIGLKQITPIRGLLEMCDKRERRSAGGREVRRMETCRENEDVKAGIVSGQTRDKQSHVWSEQRNVGLHERKKESQQSNLKAEREKQRGWIRRAGQVENSQGTCGEVERLRERYLQKVDETYEKRERHLQQYHRKLQQFTPSSASSCDHLFSPSTCPSFSSLNQGSSSSSTSPHHDLQNNSDTYRTRVEVKTDNNGQISCFPCVEQAENSPNNKNKGKVGHGDSGGTTQDLSISLETKKAEYGEDRGKSEERTSLKATDQDHLRLRNEDRRPAGVEQGGERHWPLIATTETEQTDMMTGARQADGEALASYTCDSAASEGELDASNSQADDIDGTCDESPHQRAPAKQPLSPDSSLTPNSLGGLSIDSTHATHASSNLPLTLQNVQRVLSSSCGEKEPACVTNSNRTECTAPLATPPLTTPITLNRCKILGEPQNVLSENTAYTQVHSHSEINAKMAILDGGKTSTNSFSFIFDPLSISLLQMDQVVTASFLQGKQKNCSLCPHKNERGAGKKIEVEKEHLKGVKMAEKDGEVDDVEMRLSLLELPQAKTHGPPTADTMTTINQSEQRKDVCFATYENCGIGMMTSPIPEVALVSVQDQEEDQIPQTTPAIETLVNKAPAPLFKPSTFSSQEPSVMQAISSSVQHGGNIGSPSLQNLLLINATQTACKHAPNAHKNLAFSISTPKSENVLGQDTLPKQCQTVQSIHSSNVNISLQPNSAAESNSEESPTCPVVRPTIPLSTQEDLYHSQWRVVQAHWEHLEEMATLFREEGALLYQQPDLAFGEYVQKLGEIMERKAQCVHSMIAQLQPYLKTSHFNQPQNQGEDNHEQIT